ncbi:MAG: hypothetical protein ISR65_15710 [Bacteriovoracaceae bacterium]|nr:hypothetical protein [Bacteriovoracaceae bacterium]
MFGALRAIGAPEVELVKGPGGKLVEIGAMKGPLPKAAAPKAAAATKGLFGLGAFGPYVGIAILVGIGYLIWKQTKVNKY